MGVYPHQADLNSRKRYSMKLATFSQLLNKLPTSPSTSFFNVNPDLRGDSQQRIFLESGENRLIDSFVTVSPNDAKPIEVSLRGIPRKMPNTKQVRQFTVVQFLNPMLQ